MPTKKFSKSDRVGIRAPDLRQRINKLIEANPGRVTLSDLVRAAVEEKLERIERGEDDGIKLKVPKK